MTRTLRRYMRPQSGDRVREKIRTFHSLTPHGLHAIPRHANMACPNPAFPLSRHSSILRHSSPISSHLLSRSWRACALLCPGAFTQLFPVLSMAFRASLGCLLSARFNLTSNSTFPSADHSTDTLLLMCPPPGVGSSYSITSLMEGPLRAEFKAPSTHRQKLVSGG